MTPEREAAAATIVGAGLGDIIARLHAAGFSAEDVIGCMWVGAIGLMMGATRCSPCELADSAHEGAEAILARSAGDTLGGCSSTIAPPPKP